MSLRKSIDRKVGLLLRLRKELTNSPIASPGQEDGGRTDNDEQARDSDVSSDSLLNLETAENLKMKDGSGNLIENKGSDLENRVRSWNVAENKGSYALKAGI
jgi:hypothetical protein